MKRRSKEEILEAVTQVHALVNQGEQLQHACKKIGIHPPLYYAYKDKIYTKPEIIVHENNDSNQIMIPRKKSARNCAVFVGPFDACLSFIKELQ